MMNFMSERVRGWGLGGALGMGIPDLFSDFVCLFLSLRDR